MNVEEFVSFMKMAGSSTVPPSNPFKSDWAKIRADIAPHFYGSVPEVLEKSFPNEDPEILDYRKQTYQPKTESPIVKAITDLSRLLSTSKHSVLFESEPMQNFYRDFRIGDDDLFHYFFKVVVPNRVLDPNGILVIEPTGNGLESNSERVQISLKIIQSDRVVFNDPDFNLIIYRGISKPKYSTSVDFALNGIYMVVTDEFFGMIENGVFRLIYQHDTGMNPWFTLGGRGVPRYDNNGNTYIVYKSDFSPAVPYLNDAAIYDNQHKSVMLSTCFPIKFVDGIDCDTCHGLGKITDPDDYDNSISCSSCHGHGKKLFVSPLAGYNLSPPPSLVAENEKQRDPIRFYSPDTSTIQMTAEQSKSSLEKAEQVLNINRSLKSAQSGVAKEMDREPEYLEIAKISDDLYMKFEHVLMSIQSLVFLDTSSDITVNAPVSFDLKNEVELMAEFAESQKGMDASIRYGAYLSFIDQRYAQNDTFKQISKICVDYTSLMLFTIDERNLMLGAGQITSVDAIRAAYCFDAVLHLHYSGEIDIFNQTQNELNAVIDTALSDKFSSLATVEPDVQFGDDDEPENE
jgi:hypothetical protein